MLASLGCNNINITANELNQFSNRKINDTLDMFTTC